MKNAKKPKIPHLATKVLSTANEDVVKTTKSSKGLRVQTGLRAGRSIRVDR